MVPEASKAMPVGETPAVSMVEMILAAVMTGKLAAAGGGGEMEGGGGEAKV